MAETNQAQGAEQAKEVTPVKVSIAEIQDMLNRGLDRKQIAKHYGLTQASMKDIFQHPKLKGLKSKPRIPFELVDDAPAKVVKEHKAKAEKATTTGDATSGADTQGAAPATAPATSEAPAQTEAGKNVW